MSISLPPQTESLIQRFVQSGRYGNEADVVEAALILLEAREAEVKRAHTALKRDIQAGLDDIEEGRYQTFNSDVELKAFFEDVIRRGYERLAKKS